MRWAGHVANMEDRRNVSTIFGAGHPTKKRPLGKQLSSRIRIELQFHPDPAVFRHV
jgi:hypothetical protein